MQNKEKESVSTEVTTVVPCEHCKKVPTITKHVPPSGQDNYNAQCNCKRTPLIHGENAAEKAKEAWEFRYHNMDPDEVNKESGWIKKTLYWETELKACTSCKQVPKECKHCDGGGAVYYNIECSCKKTPLTRGSGGADSHSWNEKYFNMDPNNVNAKAGYRDKQQRFHYYT